MHVGQTIGRKYKIQKKIAETKNFSHTRAIVLGYRSRCHKVNPRPHNSKVTSKDW